MFDSQTDSQQLKPTEKARERERDRSLEMKLRERVGIIRVSGDSSSVWEMNYENEKWLPFVVSDETGVFFFNQVQMGSD